jgi:DNA-binding response OmpR family regulator/HPt (histidine-containing phosphotransfer) domain-containing protein
MKILLVEDDLCITSALLEGLSAHHYLVNTTENGQTGLDLAKTFDYDVILLDVLLPGLDGLNLCRQLRAQGCQTPILILSAKAESCDRVVGLEAGADDYLVKPFEFSELIARIQALLRRGRQTSPAVLEWGELSINAQSQEVTYQGRFIHLTPKEYGLLELFLRNPHQLFTRSAILDHLWSLDKYPGEEAVNTHIKVLRQKLKDAGLTTRVIETVYGMGYRLKSTLNPKDEPVEQRPKTSRPTTRSSVLDRQEAEAKVAESIAKIWEVFKTHWHEQLSLLRQVSEQFGVGTVEEDVLKQASIAAHRLVGALGTFGRPEGTEVARRIETLLQSEAAPDPNAALQLSNLIELLRQIIEDPCPAPKHSRSLPQISVTEGKVMVVDDDPQILEILPKVLEPLGLQVTTLDNPRKFWEVLESSVPNLLILDVEMPYFNGIDLCQMIRNDRRWGRIPILFLTAHANPQIQHRVFAAGADDYVAKPIVPSELTTRVLNRLERVRGRQKQEEPGWSEGSERSSHSVSERESQRPSERPSSINPSLVPSSLSS